MPFCDKCPSRSLIRVGDFFYHMSGFEHIATYVVIKQCSICKRVHITKSDKVIRKKEPKKL